MDDDEYIQEAREIVAAIPHDQLVLIQAARERYMQFERVSTPCPEEEEAQVLQDRAAFPHLLWVTDEGAPWISTEWCADFIALLYPNLRRDWCMAWDEVAFVDETPSYAIKVMSEELGCHPLHPSMPTAV